jgi:alkylation response protein AidB-like acyl-CoA dehydrogenase
MILSEQQIQIRDMARDFARERLAPGAAERDVSHAFPKAELKEMGELGFLGMLVPEAYGGSETGTVAYAVALEEIAAGDGPCSTIMSVHSSVGCVPILKFGTEEQKQRFLPKLASGEWIGGFALTEPQAGRMHPTCAPAPAATAIITSRWRQAVHHVRQERQCHHRLRRHRSRCRQEGHYRLHRADRYAGL